MVYSGILLNNEKEHGNNYVEGKKEKKVIYTVSFYLYKVLGTGKLTL